MITHTSDSHQIPSQNKTKSKLQIWKNAKNFGILQETVHVTHLRKLLDKMYKYEMDPTRIVGTTEQTHDAGRMDGQTDGRMNGRSETNIPPYNFVVRGGIMKSCLQICGQWTLKYLEWAGQFQFLHIRIS